MEYNLEYQKKKNHNKNRFKSAEFEQLEESSENDKSIIDFDDEYSEVSNLYGTKQQNQNNEEVQILEQYEDDPNNYYEYSDPRMQSNTMEKQIINQNLKKLMEIDVNDKKGIIDLLMQDNLIQQKGEVFTEKNKNKFYYIESKNKRELSGGKKNTYGRQGFQIEAQEGDPEFIKDINVAACMLKDQIQEKNEDVAKLLFDELTPSPSNKKILTRKQIGEKVQKALEKKRKNLEKIEAKMYEEQKAEETFCPVINHRRKDGNRRNLNIFLKEQNDFQKKVEQKKMNILKKSESEKKILNIGHPFIDKNSKELAKKVNNDENVYLRLYKNSKDKNKEKEKINERKIIEEKEKKMRQKKIRKNAYSHIKSKIDIFHKTPSQMIDNKNKKNKTEPNEVKFLKKRNNSVFIINGNKKLFDIKDLPTNRILWNKFNKNFYNELKKLNINNNNSNNNEDELELDEYQYHQLLFNLGMISFEPEKKEKDENKKDNEENKSEGISPELLVENSLKYEEDKIVKNSFNLLKIDKDKIKVSDIRNFLIFVLNIQNYEFYHQYKTKHSPEEIKNIFPLNKYKKEELPELMLKKYNEELNSEIDNSNPKNIKYYYVSKDNKIIFTLDKSPLIKKDFNMLSLNYMNQKKKSNDEKIIKYIKKYPFKPKIDENSEKIYQNYKEKISVNQNETNSSNSQFKKSNMEYIDRILLMDKKRIAENQKIKEELEKKQLQECTFKPKINITYPLMKKNSKEKNKDIDKNSDENKNKDDNKKSNEEKKNINRIEELYEKGKKELQSRKDRTKEEIEIEQQKNECTFQPYLYDLNKEKIPENNFSNDIYNEKEYKYLYERLKHGRLERMVKESNNDRYGLSNELKQFVKDNKEFNCLPNQDYLIQDQQHYYNTYNDQIDENNFENFNSESGNNNIEEENGNENGNENGDININNNENNNYENNNDKEEDNEQKDMNNSEYDPEKKDDIPLLIIDVNIRQGIKKKIYVYEGDTPEALAEKFAKEHNLEPEIQNKLQNLIHNHMVKLLTRIEEENQSVSEKSQNTNNKKIN